MFKPHLLPKRVREGMIPILVWRDGRQYLCLQGQELLLPAAFDRLSLAQQQRLIAALERLRESAVEVAAQAKKPPFGGG